MSIRLKLLISYICMILIPIVLVILFLHLLFHLFVGNIEEMRHYYHVEKTFFDEVLNDDLPIYINLQNYTKEDPELLRDPYFLEQYEEQLDKRRTVLVVKEEEDVIYQSGRVEDELLVSLSHESEVLKASNNQQGFINTDIGTWLYTTTNFHFTDGTEGSYYLILDIEPVYSFVRTVVPALVIIFLLAFMITNGALTYVVSKHIIDPLKALHQATNRIKSGDLQHSIFVKRDDEIGELSHAFEEMRIRLKDSVEKQVKYEHNRKELINNISHDLKTPITSIKGYVEGILDGVADDHDKLEKYCKTIQAKAIHMDRLIDELLLFSKLDLNSVAFHFEKVEIVEFIKVLLEEMKLDFEKQNIHVKFESSLDKGECIRADRDKLERSLRNILSNSLKFLDKEQKEIMISLKRTDHNISIMIKDNGQGIKEQDLPNVFKRFYRGDSSRNTEHGGSGIGLAIVKQIIQAHGGKVSIESTYGEGTSFFVTLNVWEEGEDLNGEDINY
ncbi:cell wall metabolism sensor histidine kinase WalK [Halalkalibacter sp. APA_J-10(15)]|uniref:sensor histidine kinase n=1 Tax=Halalkalibacter sp. APA_J-10(15) TaxID=2933805 RepID=UPI001FF45C7B|nr:HAMP domain-containing sensor histidine kinase [Halalkalibacter sp. APA_J-10(15)]MCK0471189.1 HAMP domain-containing histidine kinase [Halalkalibacter sp. APA_J-10(15)]